MIRTSRQLKDKIRNLAKEKSADAQLLMRSYMTERFLERLAFSEFKDKLILKGGMLVAAMVGLDARSTMDMDATVEGVQFTQDEVKRIVNQIISIPLDDGVLFRINRVTSIMEEAEYPGFRISLESEFDGVITPLKVDLSTGDVITPSAVQFPYRLMFEERSINIRSYNLETVLAEKFETIIHRNVLNTRMRDFYDIFILLRSHGHSIRPVDLHQAVTATSEKRRSIDLLKHAEDILAEVEESSALRSLWNAYQTAFPYAEAVTWEAVMSSVYEVWSIIH